MEKGKYNIYMELGKDMSNNGRSGVGRRECWLRIMTWSLNQN